MLETCTETCGYTSSLISCLAFGTFAVPIKSKSATRVDVDPLVFQSYKTLLCFLTSWIVLPLGQDLTYTPWGIVSGIFWVPAGIAAIYAVKNAGLAVSQGTWSSIIVLVSFVWGIGVFGEGVKSPFWAGVGVLLMVGGLWGMSFYSSGEVQEEVGLRRRRSNSGGVCMSHPVDGEGLQAGRGYEVVDSSDSMGGSSGNCLNKCLLCVGPSETEQDTDSDTGESVSSAQSSTSNLGHTDDELGPDCVTAIPSDSDGEHIGNSFASLSSPETQSRPKVSKRTLGLLSAVFNGVWGGSIMAPMHFAPKSASGFGFVISFAIGASIVTLAIWVARYCYNLHRCQFSFLGAYHALPSFHLRAMWIPGGLAGLLWSTGNVCSMISVQTLGEGVGYSVTQASMLVSGLWGIFYFREVTGFVTRIKWLGAALVTIVGILILSYEHRQI